MNYQENKYRQKITLGQSGNALMMLIAISLIMFVGLAFLKAVWYFNYPKETALALFNKNVLGWFVMPAELNQLLAKPWTIISQMFVHDNVWKVFSNMLWLWCFGYIMQDLTGNRKITPVFIYGSIGGVIAFLLAYNFLPSLKELTPTMTLFGAAPGVMAVAIATTMMSPGYRIFPMISGGIPLWVLTAVYVIADLATVSVADTGILITHLAGGVTGFLFIYFYRMGYDWSNWMSNFFEWANNLFNPNKPKKGVSIKDELFYKSTKAPFKKTPNLTQQRIDDILDKINVKGFESLSEEEKELLKRASKEEL